MKLQRIKNVVRRVPGVKRLAKFNPLSVPMLYTHADNTYGTDTARGAFYANVDAIVALLETNNISYFLVKISSPERPYSIAISENDKKLFMDVLNSDLSENYGNMYIAYPWPGLDQSGFRTQGHIKSDSTKLIENASFVRLWTNYASPKGTIIFGRGFGCEVEFWQEGNSINNSKDIPSILGIKLLKDLEGSLIAPRANRVTRWVPQSERKIIEVEIRGKKYKTLPCFTQRLLDEVDFTIDFVCSWVDGNDPKWRNEMLKYKNNLLPNDVNNGSSRYESRDELKYALRSVHMFASHFIGNIYIITDGQRPKWLADNSGKVHIIDHKDIFNNKDSLPVYNSHAINSQGHHIKDLKEHYIYSNDDMFFCKTASATDFFYPSGIMKVNFSPAQFGVGKPLDSEAAPSSAGKNARSLILKAENRYITNKTVHTPLPQRRSVAYDLEKKFRSAINKTAKSKFRSSDDIAFANTTHLSYAVAKGLAVPHKYRTHTINISHPDAGVNLENLKNNRIYKTFCLNDTNTAPEDIDRVNKTVVSAMEYMFPLKAPWEK